MWTEEQLQQYDEQGFLFCPGLLSAQEVERITTPLPAILGGNDEEDGAHREREFSGAVRSVFCAHRTHQPIRDLVRLPQVLEPAQQILKNDVYIWHSKMNIKDAFEGTVWLWHQDYGYWMRDGVEPRLVSVMLFLDRATLNNGCLMVAAGSHKWGVLDHFRDEVTTSYKQWCVQTEVLKERLTEEMIHPIVGNPGDALFFHPSLLHGSGHNMSPLPRKTMIVVYNAIDNKPRDVEDPRPDWVVSRDFEVVQ